MLDDNLLTEKYTKSVRQKEMLICPRCEALHTATAQFCRNDGTPLKDSLSKNKESVEPVLNNDAQKEPEQNITKMVKNHRTSGAVFALIFILFLSGMIGLYLLGLSEDKLYNTTADNSESYADKQLSLNNSVSTEHKDISHISHEEKESPVNTAMLEVEINRVIRKNGINTIYVEIDADLTATIRGVFNTKNDRQKTLSLLKMHEDIKGVKDAANLESQAFQISASQLEEQISSALKNTGLEGITVEVNAALQATLKGAVKSIEEKNKAFEVAMLFKDIKRIKDLIFVVEH